jgi:formyl-CoA transferase
MLPLEGIRVVDFSRVLAGPWCSMLLGDLGADVVKIERPGAGDDTRHWGPPFAGGESAYYLCCNRNKRSVTLNLKDPRGRELAQGLAKQADVVIENFLPESMDAWGLGYEALSRDNPGLVYCSITGFGQTGPRRLEPGYDITIQAMAGVMSITGDVQGGPMKVGVAIADITAGITAWGAVLATLFARGRSGRGERVDISLFDSTVSWLANVGSNYLVSCEVPSRHGTGHPNIVPYQAFAAADGELIVAVGNDSQFKALCQVLGEPALAGDPRFSTNAGRVAHRENLVAIVSARLAERPRGEWLKCLANMGVPCGPVNTLDQVFADPQIKAREMVIEVMHPTIGPLRLAGSPFKLGSSSERPRRPPPLLGEHTAEVLGERLGLSAMQIEELRSAGSI